MSLVRTRNGSRAVPSPRDTARQTAELVDIAAAEVADLVPRLVDAIEKDRAQTNDGVRTPASRAPGSPVNLAVVDAAARLSAEIPRADVRARRRLGDSGRVRDIPACLAACCALYQRLAAQDPGLAAHYANAVFSWQRLARKAIGLDQPARPIGHDCPLHDDPATPLLASGAQGELHHVKPGTREAITWRQGELVTCAHCAATWNPAQWPMLGRLIQDRDQRIEEDSHADAC